ncbi:MAG: glycosyltransferase family 2 protein [Candidatus Hydrogenedentes bacterium]|nr:glycosyltransferase family 2 protein [Candidatus Hydrogenedentota bacterium]
MKHSAEQLFRIDDVDGAVLSIIIVNWNAKPELCACLGSLNMEAWGAAIEVIVVDNASSDDSVAVVKACFPYVHVLENSTNRGFAAANNQGMRQATGRYILLLNPDTELRTDTLEATLTYLGRHPDVAIVGCRCIRANGEIQSTTFRYPRLSDVFINVFVPNSVMRRSKLLGRARYVGVDPGRERNVEVIAGCYMFFRRQVYDTIGGLDERFFMYGEEVDWCYRASAAGFVIRYVPHIEITHLGGVSAAQCAEEMSLAMARSQLLLIQKIRGTCAAYVANQLMLWRDVTRVTVYGLVSWLPSVRRLVAKENVSIARKRLPVYVRGLVKADWTNE